MKKIILLLISSVMLMGCHGSKTNQETTSSTDVVETDKTQRYEFDLTKDNLWYFIDSAYSTANSSSYYYTCIYTFSGVLSYAYYENVTIYLDYDIVRNYEGGGNYPSETHKAKIEFKLNAGGNGVLSLPYDYVPENAVPKITGSTLYGYSRTLTITSVTGKVKFAI